jgi:hypothetical protein
MELEGKDKEMFDLLKASIEGAVKDMNKGNITEQQAKDLIAKSLTDNKIDLENNDTFKELKEALNAQGLTLKAMQDNPRKEKIKPLAVQIKEQMEARKDELARFKSGAAQGFPLVLKVAAEMSSSNADYDQEYIEPGYTMPQRYANTLLTWLKWGNSTKEAFSYIQMKNNDGAAAIQADGTIAPLVDFDLAKTTSVAADAVGRVDISEDTLDDYDGLANLIQNELKYAVDLVLETAIYTVIKNAAGAFALTTLKVVKPNVLDCIRAAATQIEESGFGMADTVVLRPSDWFNLVSSKDLEADYVMIPIVTYQGTVIDNLKVLKSTGVEADHILVMDSTKVNVLSYQTFAASFGYIANNFGEFVMTLRGKRRDHKFVKSNNAGSFVYDDITTIKAAILEV